MGTGNGLQIQQPTTTSSTLPARLLAPPRILAKQGVFAPAVLPHIFIWMVFCSHCSQQLLRALRTYADDRNGQCVDSSLPIQTSNTHLKTHHSSQQHMLDSIQRNMIWHLAIQACVCLYAYQVAYLLL